MSHRLGHAGGQMKVAMGCVLLSSLSILNLLRYILVSSGGQELATHPT